MEKTEDNRKKKSQIQWSSIPQIPLLSLLSKPSLPFPILQDLTWPPWLWGSDFWFFICPFLGLGPCWFGDMQVIQVVFNQTTSFCLWLLSSFKLLFHYMSSYWYLCSDRATEHFALSLVICSPTQLTRAAILSFPLSKLISLLFVQEAVHWVILLFDFAFFTILMLCNFSFFPFICFWLIPGFSFRSLKSPGCNYIDLSLPPCHVFFAMGVFFSLS